MRAFKQITANDVELRPLPFLRELSMESYLVENEGILKLDENDFSDVSVIDVELSLKGGRKYSDGRIDILVQYGQDTFGVVELKIGTLSLLHLEQLEDYMKERKQLFDTYIRTKVDVDYKDIKWVGVVVGSDISVELEEKLSNGYQIENSIPVASLTISRFRGEDNQVYVITDTILNNKSRHFDRTKFIYNGETFGKGKLVLEVIKDYAAAHKTKTYSELKLDFPNELQGSTGVLTTKEKALEIYEKTGYKRHYIKEEELIKLEDGNVSRHHTMGEGKHIFIYRTGKRIRI